MVHYLYYKGVSVLLLYVMYYMVSDGTFLVL